MINPKILFAFLTIVFLYSSCANRKINISSALKDWEQQSPESDDIEHTMYLIGDAGDYDGKNDLPALTLLKRKLDKASKNSSVIFLGDNIYPNGLPPKSDRKDRKNAESRLDAQLATLKNYQGRPLFIPGNHDWKNTDSGGYNARKTILKKN